MDQTAKDRLQREVEEEANKLLRSAVRRVEWLQYGDESQIEPGEVLPRFILTPPSSAPQREFHALFSAFLDDHAPAIRQFRRELSQRWPEVRRIGVKFEDDNGQIKGGTIRELGAERKRAQEDLTPVMVRLKAAELDTVDTLIAAGIATNRAEAIRWALTRISQRPAYEQLREHTRDVERLKSQF